MKDSLLHDIWGWVANLDVRELIAFHRGHGRLAAVFLGAHQSRIPQRSDLCLPPATGAGAQPQRGYRHHRGAPKRQLYGQPYMRTDLIKSVRILQLSSRGARWGRSAAYGGACYAHN